MEDIAAKAATQGRAGKQRYYKQAHDILVRDYEQAKQLAQGQDLDAPRYPHDSGEDDQIQASD